jgi:hypothetical protein
VASSLGRTVRGINISRDVLSDFDLLFVVVLALWLLYLPAIHNRRHRVVDVQHIALVTSALLADAVASRQDASTSGLFGKVRETPQRETTPFYPRSPRDP